MLLFEVNNYPDDLIILVNNDFDVGPFWCYESHWWRTVLWESTLLGTDIEIKKKLFYLENESFYFYLGYRKRILQVFKYFIFM